ncbi:hypothetical protein AVEN_187658-1 [Araneus ventricosus]|uniref:Uncharacterized protein n=1 Tax=Araneus ventricosus TaxID=182803 RepID=A0A4Y2U2E7_ARAVE|nr:hypothetical protein AVEN_187658-1 [Araneus ventricosus]
MKGKSVVSKENGNSGSQTLSISLNSSLPMQESCGTLPRSGKSLNKCSPEQALSDRHECWLTVGDTNNNPRGNITEDLISFLKLYLLNAGKTQSQAASEFKGWLT